MGRADDAGGAAVADADRVASVRRELLCGDVALAIVHFQRLSKPQHPQWLDAVLGDLFDYPPDCCIPLATALRFLDQLPDRWTALRGCRVVYGAMTELVDHAGNSRVVALDIGLARLVRALRCELTGRARAQAERYWHTWFRPTVHAIAKSKSVVIESSARREPLFAGSAAYTYDADRRNVFTWRQQWTPALVHAEQWLLVPVEDSTDRFYLETVAYGERVFVDSAHGLGSLALGVFAWRNSLDPKASVGAAAHWQLLPLGKPANEEYALYNPHVHAYLSSSGAIFDSSRRFLAAHPGAVVTPSGEWCDELKWCVRPQRRTPLERGAVWFYEARYDEAEREFTTALAGQAELEFLPKLTALAYRLASRAACEPRNTNAIQSDFDAIERLGGASAALVHGFYAQWRLGAQALGVMLPHEIERDYEPHGTTLSTKVLASHIAEGNTRLVQRQYAQALAAFRQVTAIQPSATDATRCALKATAQLNCAKCFFAMGHAEEALVMLEAMAGGEHPMTDSSNLDGVLPLDMDVRVLLLSARCRRTLRQFDDATALLRRALDRLASLPLLAEDDSAVDSHSWLRAGPSNQTLGDSEVEQLVHLFQCPLSLEFMRDPVVTPSGNTYEREMIERHIESVGPWDPLTRTPLAKLELYPNRALKTLMATMLSEHRLGRLLREAG